MSDLVGLLRAQAAGYGTPATEFAKARRDELIKAAAEIERLRTALQDAGHYAAVCPVPSELATEARAEMSEKITDLTLGLGLLVGGSVLLVPALVILLQAAVAALIAAEIATVWATLIVGGAALAIGGALLAVGISRLKAARPIPTKTIEQFEQDAEIAKSQLRDDDRAPDRAA